MTVEHAVSTAGITVKVFPDFYDSNKKYLDSDGNELPRLSEWIAYNLVMENYEYSDDWDSYTERSIDVHFYSKNKAIINSMKVALRNALRTEGYIIRQTLVSYESDTYYYHLTISVLELTNTEV